MYGSRRYYFLRYYSLRYLLVIFIPDTECTSRVVTCHIAIAPIIGGHFCAGWDLSQFEKVTSEVRAALGPSASEAQVRAAVAKRMDAFFELLHPKNPLAGIVCAVRVLRAPQCYLTLHYHLPYHSCSLYFVHSTYTVSLS